MQIIQNMAAVSCAVSMGSHPRQHLPPRWARRRASRSPKSELQMAKVSTAGYCFQIQGTKDEAVAFLRSSPIYFLDSLWLDVHGALFRDNGSELVDLFEELRPQLQVKLASMKGRVGEWVCSVTMSCDGARSWSLVVPVASTAASWRHTSLTFGKSSCPQPKKSATNVRRTRHCVQFTSRTHIACSRRAEGWGFGRRRVRRPSLTARRPQTPSAAPPAPHHTGRRPAGPPEAAPQPPGRPPGAPGAPCWPPAPPGRHPWRP